MANLKMRLMKGASVLAKLWREGKRCASRGWAPACECVPDQKTKFCGAKMFWVSLATQDGREVRENEGWGIFLAMRAKELEAVESSGLTLVIEHPDHGRIRIGKKGEASIQDFVRLVDAPDGVDGFLKILKVFPKAKVVRAEAAKKTVRQ